MMEGAAKRRALGRGLGALIPGAYTIAPPSAANTMVALASIRPGAHQPRRAFDEDRINELADSIRQKGILQPLLVRAVDDGYELIAGERRYRAAQRVGLEQVPVTI